MESLTTGPELENGQGSQPDLAWRQCDIRFAAEGGHPQLQGEFLASECRHLSVFVIPTACSRRHRATRRVYELSCTNSSSTQWRASRTASKFTFHVALVSA